MSWLASLFLGTSAVFTVIDGDTVRLPGGQAARLQGFNAPEVQSRCYAERTLAIRAKARLTTLADQGAKLTINPGTCGYGRKCGTLIVHGEDAGAILVREGLAEPMKCRGNECPRPRDWCAGGTTTRSQ